MSQCREVLNRDGHLDTYFRVYKVDNRATRGDGDFVMPTTVGEQAGKRTLPSEEQALVDEFAAMMRRHRDQHPGDLARLLNLAYVFSIGTGASREDKLARAQLRGLQARQQLADAEGGSLSSEEVARLLGISKTAVLKRLTRGRLLAWREERLQAARFPRWQFDEQGQVLAGLEATLEILNRDAHLNPWGKILFFLREKGSLGGRRPLDLLREGKSKELCLSARAYAD